MSFKFVFALLMFSGYMYENSFGHLSYAVDLLKLTILFVVIAIASIAVGIYICKENNEIEDILNKLDAREKTRLEKEKE